MVNYNNSKKIYKIRINKIMDSKESKMLFELHLKESRRDQSLMRILTKITTGLLIRIQMKFKKNNTIGT